MASNPATDDLEVVEIVAYDRNDRKNKNVENKRLNWTLKVWRWTKKPTRLGIKRENNAPDAVVDSKCDAGDRQKCTSSRGVSSEFLRRVSNEALENNH